MNGFPDWYIECFRNAVLGSPQPMKENPRKQVNLYLQQLLDLQAAQYTAATRPQPMKENPMATQATWTPGALLQLLSDLEKAAPAVYAALAPIVADLLNIFGGKAQAKAPANVVGCPDAGQCFDAVIAAQVQGLAAAVQGKCCCPPGPNP